MYDVRVAVSLQSSFIWERLDLGLEASYLHEFADPEMNVFERAALGRYAVNVCPSVEDLIEKVRAGLHRRRPGERTAGGLAPDPAAQR